MAENGNQKMSFHAEELNTQNENEKERREEVFTTVIRANLRNADNYERDQREKELIRNIKDGSEQKETNEKHKKRIKEKKDRWREEEEDEDEDDEGGGGGER
jgi:hypothetical protein